MWGWANIYTVMRCRMVDRSSSMLSLVVFTLSQEAWGVKFIAQGYNNSVAGED